MRRRFMLLAACAALGANVPGPGSASVASGQTPAAAEEGEVTLAANPARVCLDTSDPAYLNFDLVVRNGSAAELGISELRGLVLNPEGGVIERRLIWQQSLEQLSPDRVVPPRGEALIFNPLLFASAGAGSTIRFELDLGGRPPGSPPLAVTVAPQDCAHRHRLVLPVAGRVLVYDGYDLYSHHRRTGYGGPDDAALGITDNFQRFGIDLVVVDAQGRFFTGDGMRTDQWLGWGAPVRAAGAGTVAAAHDGQPDNIVIGSIDRWTDRDIARNPMTSYGNYVLIDHGEGEFSLVAHLREGSVTVRPGERVEAGRVVGQIGNSGASGGVHVHFERRTGPGIAGIETLPPSFHDVAVVGRGTAAGPVAVNTGDVIVSR